MPRGSSPGERRGGRKRGTPNKTTAAQRLAAIESGLPPLDFLLSVMREDRNPIELRIEAAKAAAPFVHARLSAVNVGGKAEELLIVKIVRFGDEPDPA